MGGLEDAHPDDRYKISRDRVLGRGATAHVYAGLDVVDCRSVAVKLFTAEESQSSNHLEEFKKVVSVLCRLGASSIDPKRLAQRRVSTSSFDADLLQRDIAHSVSSNSTQSTDSLADPILDEIDTSSCYVSLLDYSRTSGGEAGFDHEEHLLFLVMELGEESLQERLQSYAKRGESLSVQELRELQWALCSMVWGLHAVGFVHMDIKPQNIMRFRSGGVDQWKLIDLDGAMETGVDLGLEHCTFTPEYMPPELAVACGRRSTGSANTITLSRLMDVWSVGMCSLEAIFLQPVLRPWMEEWRRETGSDRKYFRWLADYSTEPIISGDLRDHLVGIDEDMCSFLEKMLAKDPQERSSIAECLTHPWFQPLRSDLLESYMERRVSMIAMPSGRHSSLRGSREKRASHICTLM
eukprot:CAMPEP_0171114306 /NCGR_PEP_ID=MMETSP0766_2-20121228/85002_1 /TAXON_ID=439317 /ORGANISM="Gambierdiscus australes, Strain CAWD 149" /LENGTH=408 /DNA_ID=CAMNT_0011576597 /DNA_START=65 /DNA_END=1292 /DNA_ORIENTATION=-